MPAKNRIAARNTALDVDLLTAKQSFGKGTPTVLIIYMPTWHLGPARFSFSSVPPACIAVVGSKATMLTRSLCGSVHDYVRIPSSIKPLIRVVGVEDETSSAACWFGFHIHAKVGSAGQALPGLAIAGPPAHGQ